LLLCALLPLVRGEAAELKPEAAQAFDRYVGFAERRMQTELAPSGVFLWVNGLSAPQRDDARKRLQRGEVISARLQTTDTSGRISAPGALMHHWVGTVFIPGATLQKVLTLLQDYDHHSEYFKPEVVKSKTIARSDATGSDFKVYLRIERKKVITVVLDTEYDVHYRTLDPTRALSNSYSTRIAEVEHAGESGERQMPPGEDHGFLWRLNSYWRFAEADRGVYVQCEAISLTRDIPTGLNWFIAPFIESIPKESLEFTLQLTKAAALHGILQSPR
jgi:hypothetical protein